MITNCTYLTGLYNFVVFEKFTRAYLYHIALKIMLLPLHIWGICHVLIEPGNDLAHQEFSKAN